MRLLLNLPFAVRFAFHFLAYGRQDILQCSYIFWGVGGAFAAFSFFPNRKGIGKIVHCFLKKQFKRKRSLIALKSDQNSQASRRLPTAMFETSNTFSLVLHQSSGSSSFPTHRKGDQRQIYNITFFWLIFVNGLSISAPKLKSQPLRWS